MKTAGRSTDDLGHQYQDIAENGKPAFGFVTSA